MLITTAGIIIRLRCDEVSTYGRNASGVKLINLDKDVVVAKIAKVRQTAEGTDGQEEELPEGEVAENTDEVTPENGAENTEDISGKDTEE